MGSPRIYLKYGMMRGRSINFAWTNARPNRRPVMDARDSDFHNKKKGIRNKNKTFSSFYLNKHYDQNKARKKTFQKRLHAFQ